MDEPRRLPLDQMPPPPKDELGEACKEAAIPVLKLLSDILTAYGHRMKGGEQAQESAEAGIARMIYDQVFPVFHMHLVDKSAEAEYLAHLYETWQAKGNKFEEERIGFQMRQLQPQLSAAATTRLMHVARALSAYDPPGGRG